MQAKSTRDKNIELFNSVAIKVESTDKLEKPSTSTDPKTDTCNGIIKKEPIDKEEVLPYEKKYFALLKRCEMIKQSNERLFYRIYYVKKLLRRRKKEKKFLMDRLDGYGDDYKTMAAALFSEMIGDSSPVRPPQPEVTYKSDPKSVFLTQVKTEPNT